MHADSSPPSLLHRLLVPAGALTTVAATAWTAWSAQPAAAVLVQAAGMGVMTVGWLVAGRRYVRDAGARWERLGRVGATLFFAGASLVALTLWGPTAGIVQEGAHAGGAAVAGSGFLVLLAGMAGGRFAAGGGA